MYVLITKEDCYFVEFLLGELIISKSIEEAMEFDDYGTAEKFRDMLRQVCDLHTSISTYIK